MIADLSGYSGNYARITSLDSFNRLVDRLYNSDKTISFDVETGYTGPDVAKLSLDVYHPLQFIVGFAFTNDVRWARYVPLLHDYGNNLDPEKVWTIIKPLLEDKTIVCHNVSFEAKNLAALERKGHGPAIHLKWENFHDTMLQSYVLSETRFHGLKGLTKEHYNYSQREIDSLFDKLTEKKKSALRFNPLDIENPDVTNYVCDDVTWTLRLDNDQRPRAEAERGMIYKMEREIAGILIDMAETGISVDWEGIHEGVSHFGNFYQLMENDTRKKFEAQVGRDLTGLNFRSTQQMQKLLFDHEDGLGLRPAQKTKKGAPSTSDVSLEAIRQQNPAVDQLLRYRGAKKMGEWFLDWNTRQTAYDHKLHPNFKQTTVQSGRFACDAPNVQNITKKWWFTVFERNFDTFPRNAQGDKDFEEHVKAHGKHGTDYWTGNARDYLIASPGYTLLSFDYSQQELRVLAGLAQEPYLQEAFKEGKDIHKATASLMFNVPLEEVTSEQRQRAKTINFGLIYQQGAKALGDSLGITKEEAQSLFDRYFSAFSKVDQWFAKTKREGKEKEYVESFFGRKSTLWDYRSEYDSIRSKGDRMAVNVPVQGGGADITKLAMIRTKRMLVNQGWWGTQVRLLMNQHDSLVFEVSNELDLVEVKNLITPMVSFPVKGFPNFKIDWEAGLRWGSCKKWENDDDFQTKKLDDVVEKDVVDSEDEIYDFQINFNNSSKVIVKQVIETLKANPGASPVIFSVGGQYKETGIKVKPSQLLVSEIMALSSGTCEVGWVK